LAVALIGCDSSTNTGESSSSENIPSVDATMSDEEVLERINLWLKSD
jgi:hypothetical protein